MKRRVRLSGYKEKANPQWFAAPSGYTNAGAVQSSITLPKRQKMMSCYAAARLSVIRITS